MSNVLAISRPLTGLARTISDVLSPPVLAIPGLTLGVWASDVQGTYRYAVLYFVMAVLPPVFYVVWLMKTGRITDFHLPDRRERTGPFLVSLVCGLLSLGVMIYMGAPTIFMIAIVGLLVQTFVLFLITLVWQISIHTATAAGVVTFAVLSQGAAAGVFFLSIPLIAWARVYLGRHSLAQTIAGAFVGCLCFTLLFAVRGLVW